jgi:hypothetical protein
MKGVSLARLPPNILVEACQAGDMLWMAPSADQSKSQLHSTANLVAGFAFPLAINIILCRLSQTYLSQP